MQTLINWIFKIPACFPPAVNLRASHVSVAVNLPVSAGYVRDMGSILCWEDSQVLGTATHSRILAWRIPWTEEPGGLESIGAQESDMT